MRATHKTMLAITICYLSLMTAVDASSPFAANGMKICATNHDAAVVWVRLTERPESEADGSVPGAEGEVKVVLKPTSESNRESESDFKKVDASTDYTTQFSIQNLDPDQEYVVEAIARVPGSDELVTIATGRIQTPPLPSQPNETRFTVVTGQQYQTRDSDQGQRIYESMLELDPSFFIHTGDIVYYDKANPFAKDVANARFKWNRMYSQPLLREFHLNVPSYFLKDDHDILKDDSWPGQKYGELTWEKGLEIFREQNPVDGLPYRQARWGKDLEVWMLEGREFRSPNNEPDGPQKTILGQQQLDWLEDSTEQSNATFKVIVSPTPIVGPDRVKKNDNHANQGFTVEGDRLRKLLASRDNLYVVCGDRHWQYVSTDPETGLREYSCGPTSDKHAGGWSDDKYDPDMHKFLRVKGGFLSVSLIYEDAEPRLVFRHHAVDGTVVHEESWTASAAD